MGLGPKFSCSGNTPERGYVNLCQEIDNVNPDPRRFTIVDRENVNGNTLMWVHYPNCTTFKGMKLLLLKGRYMTTDFKELDPHFLDDPGHLVIARFIPNDAGYEMAVAAANAY